MQLERFYKAVSVTHREYAALCQNDTRFFNEFPPESSTWSAGGGTFRYADQGTAERAYAFLREELGR